MKGVRKVYAIRSADSRNYGFLILVAQESKFRKGSGFRDPKP